MLSQSFYCGTPVLERFCALVDAPCHRSELVKLQKYYYIF